MSKKKKQQVIDAFKSADKNGDGKIDLEEYVQHFKVCNLNIPTLYYTNQISDLKS